MSNIEEKLFDIIAKCLKKNKNKVELNSHLTDDLGADSLDIVELMMSIESEFSIKIPLSIADKMAKVNDVVDYLNKEIQKSKKI